MHIERRKYIRFLPQANAYAALRAGIIKIGKIRDISMSGLAFSYYAENNNLINETTEVDIFLTGNAPSENSFHLSNIPCKIVYDLSKLLQNDSNFIVSHRCGIIFRDQSKNYVEELSSFINNYTIAPIV